MFQFSTLLFVFSLAIFIPLEVKQAENNIGSIKGIISNEHGHPIENALIYLNKKDLLVKVATSDSLGKYEMTAIPADTFTISVSYVGYFKQEIKDIIIANDEANDNRKEIDIILKELRCTHGH